MIKHQEITTTLIFIVIVLIIILSAIGAYQEQKEWEKFSAENNCEIVGYIKGNYSQGTGLSSSAKMSVYSIKSNDQKVYKCSDGKTYTR